MALIRGALAVGAMQVRVVQEQMRRASLLHCVSSFILN